MAKEEMKRTFESELLILPALKMVLVEPDPPIRKQTARRTSAKKQSGKGFTEETVMRIIGKLSLKE
jgi:hypothetical protein